MEKSFRLHVVALAVVAVLSGIVITGCQKDDNDDDDGGRDIVRPTVTKYAPESYNLHDPDCVRQKDEVKINRTGVWGWQGLTIVDAKTELDRTITRESIISPLVSGTSYDRHYLRVCPGPSELNCVDNDGGRIGWSLKNPDQHLRACEDDFTYPRETFEGGGLTSLHYLNQAGESYRKAMGKPLRQIHLDVFPVFESQFFGRTDPDTGEKVDEKEYIADNLAYYPGHDLVVVFPQSKRFAEEGMDKFWESSFVLAHELGHHIEQVHVGAKMDQLGLKWDPLIHQYRGILDSNNELAERNLVNYWTSISEAFADLNAYYANNEDVSSLAEVDCLGKNRNITKAMFADETTEKILDSNVVLQLMIAGNQIGFCDSINLSEPHTVGAIIAHNMRRIIATLAPSAGDVPTQAIINARYKLSIAWIEAMVNAQIAQKSRDYTANNELYQPLADSIETIAANANSQQKHQICAIAEERLPILQPVPFAGYCQGF